MVDPIMVTGTVLFCGLFAFLLSLTVLVAMGLLRRATTGSTPYRPRVSVLVPAHDEQTRIAACIAALKATRYPRLEIIVIDDGSADATARVAQAMGVRVLRQKHAGKPAALNRGLSRATGDVILTIDADTLVFPTAIARIVSPLRDPRVGATSGAVLVANDHGVAGAFQRIDYFYHNLLRRSMGAVLGTELWFFGCLGAYRAQALRAIGGFPDSTRTEDMDAAIAIRAAGYATRHAPEAKARTAVPRTLRGLIAQRARWWEGGLQAVRKHATYLRTRGSAADRLLVVNQYWWALYALVSLPILAYQVWYWFPATGALDATLYLVRWCTLWGPFYVLYKIPVWGLNVLNIFGVLSGVLSFLLLLVAIARSGERVRVRDGLVLLVYFPYTIITNLGAAIGVLEAMLRPARPFRA